ncbi:MAG TPA: AAA family ATPase, partial [Microbacteriaceae bacterium]|nr:AAA family ATPase [Microbacteriaceae bacterium]
MIEEIGIHGLGVIDDATLPLAAGFTALTGETGAGKTMVVSALGLLLGQRADSGLVRPGSGVSVEGRWLVPGDGYVACRVREAGGIVDDAAADGAGAGEAGVVVTRTLAASGRSKASIG